MSAAWTRETPWRQGAILPGDAVQALGLQGKGSPDRALCVMVISHDCDLANDNLDQEPNVEVIVGRRLEEGEGNYYWSKSPRTLHIDALFNDLGVVIELVATERYFVKKVDLAQFSPDDSWDIPSQSCSALRAWLAVRYNRSAFPDGFVNLLSQNKLDSKLASLLKNEGRHISSVYFNLNESRKSGHVDEVSYDLVIVLSFLPGEDPEALQGRMDDLAGRITSEFEKKLFDTGTESWKGICLKGCMAISEDDMTLSQARRLQSWRLDYLSVKGGESHAMPVN